MALRPSLFVPVLLGLAAHAHADENVRVVAWNVQSVGAPGTTQYDAAVDVLDRLGADVVALCEITSTADVGYFGSLKTDAGYAHSAIATAGPFGYMRCGVLSDYTITSSTVHTSASLSGDGSANDLTRYILEVELDVSGSGDSLWVFTTHWKSGTGNDDEFRRTVESTRMNQATFGLDAATDAYVIVGDMNEEIDSPPTSPVTFTSLPTGLPTAFSTGTDILAMMAGSGLTNDPFIPIEDVAIELSMLQKDGSDSTRPASGRRLDYIFVSDTLWDNGVSHEVYDSADEGLSGGLAKVGSALASGTSLDASDHLALMADIVVSTGTTNLAPTANANGPYSGTEGTSIAFSSTGSADSDGTIVAYSWAFGDGGSSTLASPVHSYSSAGTYTATLTVTDNDGATHSNSATVLVAAAPNVAPIADAGGPYTGSAGGFISFDGTGSSDSDGTIASYAWTFGDGSSGTGASPSHSYPTAGTYAVGLTVTDDDGATHSDVGTVTVAGSTCTIVITATSYKRKNRRLEVRATSTDTDATLSVYDDGSTFLGDMSYRSKQGYFKLTTTVSSPPASVEVRSTCGGSDTAGL